MMDNKTMRILAVIWLLVLLESYHSYIKRRKRSWDMEDRCRCKTMAVREYFCRGAFFKGMEWSKMANGTWTYGPSFELMRYMMYRYEAEGVEYKGIDSRVVYSVRQTGKEGTETQIYYDPDHPDVFYCPAENWNAKWCGTCICIAFGVVITLLIVIFR